MPITTPFWVPAALGSVAARGANRLYRWADSEYINARPPVTHSSTSARTAMRTRTQTTTRRRYRKRNRRGVIRRRVPRALTTRRKIIRARSVVSFSPTCTAGALQNYPLVMLDVADPWSSNGNQQFLGYDQWKTLYKKAVVLGIKLSVNVHNKGTVGAMFGCTPMPESQSTTALASYNHYMEYPATKSRLLSPDVDHGIIFHKISVKKHLGVTKLLDEDSLHCDLANETGPSARFPCYHIWIQPVDASTTITAEMVVNAEFLICLFDPVVPARSTDT